MNRGGLNSGHVYQGVVPPDSTGQSVLEFLSERYRGAPFREWQRRIAQQQVRLDGRVVSESDTLGAGQVLAWHRPPWLEPAVPLGFAVLFRDDDVWAVAKPSGLPTLPGGGQFLEHTLVHQLRRVDSKLTPVHRLGRGTSGVVVCARTERARQGLSQAFREDRVHKQYRALVAGRMVEDRGEWQFPIGRVAHSLLGTVFGACSEGKPSCSRFQVLERREESTLLRVEPVTGRAHQIRIHTAAAGHPLRGDPLYPQGGVPAADCRAVPSDLGYLLHAEAVTFPHPRFEEAVTVRCGVPEELRRTVR